MTVLPACQEGPVSYGHVPDRSLSRPRQGAPPPRLAPTPAMAEQRNRSGPFRTGSTAGEASVLVHNNRLGKLRAFGVNPAGIDAGTVRCRLPPVLSASSL